MTDSEARIRSAQAFLPEPPTEPKATKRKATKRKASKPATTEDVA